MSGDLDKDIEAEFQKIIEDESSPDKPPDFPGLQYLGCGYDIFGRYASAGATRGCYWIFPRRKKKNASSSTVISPLANSVPLSRPFHLT